MSDQEKQYLQELVKLNRTNLLACGYERITVDNTSGGKSLTIPTNAKYALCILESDAEGIAARYLEVGPTTEVTSSNGIPRTNESAFSIEGYQNLLNFRIIQAQSGNHYLNVQYYK